MGTFLKQIVVGSLRQSFEKKNGLICEKMAASASEEQNFLGPR